MHVHAYAENTSTRFLYVSKETDPPNVMSSIFSALTNIYLKLTSCLCLLELVNFENENIRKCELQK